MGEKLRSVRTGELGAGWKEERDMRATQGVLASLYLRTLVCVNQGRGFGGTESLQSGLITCTCT